MEKILTMNQPILYIVVPCYNEEAMLPLSNEKLTQLLDELVATREISDKSKVMYVDDGSRDRTWELICEYASSGHRVKGVKLAGNSGHQNALMAGLATAKDHCDVIVSIDADLQDDISVIHEMLDKYKSGCDIVYGVRKKRTTDTWFKRNTALAFYKIMHGLGVKTVYNHADYRLMSQRAVEQLCQYRERNLFLRGIVPLLGYKTDSVYYDRKERVAGESKYPLSKMMNFAADGITSFSVKPVRLILAAGMVFILISFLILIYVLYMYFSHRVVAGWSSLILSVWFVGGCILVGLGIIGEYIGKIYIETKDRPRYNIEEMV